jgi:hypothetical protein
MTKSQARQVQMMEAFLAIDMQDAAARTLSFLVRSAMRNKDKIELMDIAYKTKLINNSEFIV